MSIFDTEKDQFDNIDESVAGNSLKDIMDFMCFIPIDIYYNSFTKQNIHDIEKYTGLQNLNHPSKYIDIQSNSNYVELTSTFYCVPSAKDNYKPTYSVTSNIRCARLELVRKKNIYYICPNFVRWPIVIENCGLNELPKTIKFAKKNPKSKFPLTFIVINNGVRTNWIKDLPEGSIVYILPTTNFTIRKWDSSFDGFDFFKHNDFDNFLNAYGQKIIVGTKD